VSRASGHRLAWLLAVLVATAVGALEAAPRPTEPKHAGVWIAILTAIAGLAWGLRAVVLPFAGALAFSLADYVIHGPPPVNSGDSRSVAVVLLIALVLGAIFALPAVAGAALRWAWRKLPGEWRRAASD
jgi:hypothetical protein